MFDEIDLENEQSCLGKIRVNSKSKKELSKKIQKSQMYRRGRFTPKRLKIKKKRDLLTKSFLMSPIKTLKSQLSDRKGETNYIGDRILKLSIISMKERKVN